MRHVAILAVLLFAGPAIAAVPPTQPQTTGPVTLYVSAGGNDKNTCDTPLVPCRTVNAALNRTPKMLLDPVKIYVSAGDYYLPPALPDGGAPDFADAHGLIDEEGFIANGAGSLKIIGAIKSITSSLLAVTDAGVLPSSQHPSESWFQFAPSVGWPASMVAAGYAFPDGGLVANSLADAGIFISVAAGTDATLYAPVLSNDLRTITFSTHNLANFGAPAALDATSTVAIVQSASHFHPWPVGADKDHTYALSTLYASGNSGQTSTALPFLPNSISMLPPAPPFQVLYLDLAGDPEGTNSAFETVTNFGPALLDVRYSTIYNSTWNAVVNYGGAMSISASAIYGGLLGTVASSGDLFLVGNVMSGQSGQLWSYCTDKVGTFLPISAVVAQNAHVDLASNSFAPKDGTVAVCLDMSSRLDDTASMFSMGNTTQPTIQLAHKSDAVLTATQNVGDGGAGFLIAGGGDLATLISTSPGYTNLVSLNNGISWTSSTDYTANDGGASGAVKALCDANTGSCFASY